MKKKRRAPRAPVTVDRFEGEWAVLLDDGQELRRPRSALAHDAREGDVVDLETGKVDARATENLRKSVQDARARAMKRKGPTGNFDL